MTTMYGVEVQQKSKGAKPLINFVTAAITGTGAVTLKGHRTLTGAIATVQNSATSLTHSTASVTSVSGVTVNVAVALITYSGPTAALDGGAKNVTVAAMVSQ